MKRPKIGFISLSSPSDRRASSGTCFRMAQALSDIGEVVWIPLWPSRLVKFMELAYKGINLLLCKRALFLFTYLGSKLWARCIDIERIDECDLLFAFWGGSWLANADTMGKPVIYVSDATFASMVGYYPPYSNLSARNVNQGRDIERRSMSKASVVVLSSDWAAASAVNDMGISHDKVHVIEFGANIDDSDIARHEFSYQGHLHILFLGVEWKRKGGDIAVDAVRWLNENGVPATLHVVGIKELASSVAGLPYVDHIGFLNKNISSEYDKLVATINKCHCLLLPTIAECAGIAFCEASANGLPTFTHETGGVPNYIINGKNGYMLPLGSTGKDFGMKIKECLSSGELERMSVDAPNVYRERLSWGVWERRMADLIGHLFA